MRFSDAFVVFAVIVIFRFNSTMDVFLVNFLSRGERSLMNVSYLLRKSFTFSSASSCLPVVGIYSIYTFEASSVFIASLISLRCSVSDRTLNLPGTVDVKGLVTVFFLVSDSFKLMNI
jgi:hypothetical protein